MRGLAPRPPVKDIAADLWKLLSQLTGERVTKTNLRSILQRHTATPETPQPLFTDRSIPDYQFIGREGAIARLDELTQQGQRTIVIQCEGGIGKTTLAQEYVNDPQWTGSTAYFLQSIGQIYTNLGEFDRANIIYQRTLIFCQTGNYLQIQAKTLNGIAQIYRSQGNLQLAQNKHLESIDILIQIGAKCDLAEAYYQAGLTWKAATDLDQSKNYNDNARQLFTEIAAPAQLVKISEP